MRVFAQPSSRALTWVGLSELVQVCCPGPQAPHQRHARLQEPSQRQESLGLPPTSWRYTLWVQQAAVLTCSESTPNSSSTSSLEQLQIDLAPPRPGPARQPLCTVAPTQSLTTASSRGGAGGDGAAAPSAAGAAAGRRGAAGAAGSLAAAASTTLAYPSITLRTVAMFLAMPSRAPGQEEEGAPASAVCGHGACAQM